VCAPEVKKKFQKCESKKERRPRIYFPEKICSMRGLSIAAKDASDVVAQASAGILRAAANSKTAGGTPALRKPPLLNGALENISSMTDGGRANSHGYGVSLR
jgi:hypothetical protein